MTDDWRAARDLYDAEAVDWYRAAEPWGASALDLAITGVDSAFGPSIEIGAIAPVDPLAQRPGSLFLAVAGDISDDETWGRVVAANRVLVEAAHTRATDAMNAATERLHVVVAHLPGARPLRAATQAWFRT
jgi:hypothetical protein